MLKRERHPSTASVHGHAGFSTAKQLVRVNSGRGHVPRFDKILPSAMAKLVAMDLFEPWEGTYRITPKGKQLLNELELESLLK